MPLSLSSLFSTVIFRMAEHLVTRQWTPSRVRDDYCHSPVGRIEHKRTVDCCGCCSEIQALGEAEGGIETYCADKVSSSETLPSCSTTITFCIGL